MVPEIRGHVRSKTYKAFENVILKCKIRRRKGSK